MKLHPYSIVVSNSLHPAGPPLKRGPGSVVTGLEFDCVPVVALPTRVALQAARALSSRFGTSLSTARQRPARRVWSEALAARGKVQGLAHVIADAIDSWRKAVAAWEVVEA